ncbi:MAG: DUF3841 domain-containing protein [Ferruginibacter sp.]|nr:DUF3841 domain-containing protein [Ferruginibacter sp.]
MAGSMPTERFYTIQHVNAWRVAQSTGILTGNPTFIDPHFIRPYQWIRKQMQLHHRMGKHSTGYPVWAWDFVPTPEMYTTPCVLIEFNAHPENAFITLFEEWHIILNATETEHQNEQTLIGNTILFKWKEIIVPLASGPTPADQLLQYSFEKITIDQVVSTTLL